MIYNLFTKFEFKDICINGAAKKLSSLIPQNTEVCGGVEEKIYRKIFSPSPISIKMGVGQPSKKTFLTYMNKNSLLNTLF